MRGNQRILLILGAVAVAIVAFIVINPGGGNDKASTTATPSAGSTTTGTATPAPAQNVTSATVRVVGAKPQGGIKTITANKGDQLHLTVVSDTADEIHIHGYDFKKDVTAGGSASFDFPLKIDGIFVIELENHGEQIAKLVVEP